MCNAKPLRIGLLLCVTLPALANQTEAMADDLDKLQGTWAKPAPARGRGDYKVWHFEKNTVRWTTVTTEDGEAISSITFVCEVKLSQDASPKEITLVRTDRKDLDPQLGIYELDGDTLKICFGIGERPKKFERPGLLINLTRKKE